MIDKSFTLVVVVFAISFMHLTDQVGPGEDPEEPNPVQGICYLYDDAGYRTVR